jgi:Zn-finger nucleic acid-binding protein
MKPDIPDKYAVMFCCPTCRLFWLDRDQLWDCMVAGHKIVRGAVMKIELGDKP